MAETADASTQTAVSLIECPSTGVKDFNTPPPSPVSEPSSSPPFVFWPTCSKCGEELFYGCEDTYMCMRCG